MTQAEKAARLRALHHGPQPLVFFNAWDAVSARLVESLGFPAVATSSAAVCFAQGYRDGQTISREGMLGAVARIVRTVSVPVTADLEGGYGDDVAAAAATARGAIESGAGGLNFEDRPVSGEGLLDAALQAARIAAMRAAGAEAGVPLVINARTDVFFGSGIKPAQQMEEALRRARLYVSSGADCVFVPGVFKEPQIEELVRGTGAPVNILALPQNPAPERLHALGVARISYGSAPIQLVMGKFAVAARAAQAGTFEFADDRMDYASLNDLFPR
jgi:2-methylisocitrate lyase-like PEP mutase family enzyme